MRPKLTVGFLAILAFWNLTLYCVVDGCQWTYVYHPWCICCVSRPVIVGVGYLYAHSQDSGHAHGQQGQVAETRERFDDTGYPPYENFFFFFFHNRS